MKNGWKKMILDYIMVQAEITASIGIIGSFFVREQIISYHYFFLPAFLAFICMLPCMVTYFKDDMTVRQIILQRIIEVIVIEIAMIGIIYHIVGDALGMGGYVAVAGSVLIFDIFTYVYSYMMEKNEADAINDKLKADREKRTNIIT